MWQIVGAYNDDNSRTWHRTPPLHDASGDGYPNECQTVEAANADLVSLIRDEQGPRFRKNAISSDSGKSWSSIDVDRTLPSVPCTGAVVRGSKLGDDSWNLWTSFPSNEGRQNGQIAESNDNDPTCQAVYVVPGFFAYSVLQISPDRSQLLCLYERNNDRTQTLLSLPLHQHRQRILTRQH